MRIAYDYQAFAFTPYGGGSRYLYEVSKRIVESQTAEVKIVAGLHSNHYIQQSPKGLVVGHYIAQIQDLLGLTTAIDFNWSKWWLAQYQPDVLHETYYSLKSSAPRNCKIVLTVHDMIHEKFGNLLNAGEQEVIRRKKASIERADHLICVSHNTKQDLLELIDLDPAKVSVVHHGSSLTVQQPATQSPLDSPYLLYVGPRGYYKNFQTLLEAYGQEPLLHQNFQLVCFGSSEFSWAEQREMQRLGVLDRLLHLSGDDQLLANLYGHAAAFVYPSLYEGFGIPPVEAMELGCPVVCSNAGSIPEVVGEAGRYFDPNNREDIAASILAVVNDSSLRTQLIAAGKLRAQLFSWDKCATETYAVYQKLAHES
jgi:glycosyltransferase involved in cell wall biosynthesis